MGLHRSPLSCWCPPSTAPPPAPLCRTVVYGIYADVSDYADAYYQRTPVLGKASFVAEGCSRCFALEHGSGWWA